MNETEMDDNSILTPCKWFSEGGRHFVVPVYQRLFTWEEPQFDRLLHDVTKWHKEQGEQPSIPYYLGIATVVEEKEKTNSYILVDGQQRLTVIAILSALLGWGSGCTPDDYLSYEARPQDRKTLEYIFDPKADLLKDDAIQAVEKITNANMKKFVQHIRKNLEAWRNVANALQEHLCLLISELPPAYKEDLTLQNEYFEKMNSSGKQLEQHEVLKVRLCSSSLDLERWNKVEDFSVAYQEPSVQSTNECTLLEDFSVAYQEPSVQSTNKCTLLDAMRRGVVTLNGKEVELKEKPTYVTPMSKWAKALVDFPMFLVHVRKLLNWKECHLPSDAHELLEIFANHPIGNEKKQQFMKTMVQYREFLDFWMIHQKVDEEKTTEMGAEGDTSFYYWNNAHAEVAFCASGGESEEYIKKALKQVQMALYALGGDQQGWLLESFNERASLGDCKALHIYLRKKLIVKAAFGDLSNLTSWPANKFQYGENLRAPLICLDYFLWELSASDDKLKKEVFGELKLEEEQAIRKYYPRKNNRSVEHFHPRTDERSPYREAWKDAKHHFGNLALITPGQNSKFGNDPVPGKCERLKDLMRKQSIESVKLLLMAKMCDGLDEHWQPQQAEEHANMMLKVIQWGLKQVSQDNQL